MGFRLVLVSVVLLGGRLALAQEGAAPEPGAACGTAVQAAFGKLPLYFIENRGAFPEEVAYYVTGADKTLFFSPEGVTFRLRGKDGRWVVKLDFVGSSPVKPRGEDGQKAVFSYFTGPEKDWKAGLPTFSRVVYEDLWPGIDLVYSGTVNKLKYELVVEPGVDPSVIRLRYRGADAVQLTGTGAIRVETRCGSFEDAPPVAFQEAEGKRSHVRVAFAADPAAPGEAVSFGFRVGKYDCTKPLILDPALLVYCGYIGGSLIDAPAPMECAIAVDTAGAAYVVGTTQSTEQTFPVTVGPDLTHNGSYDTFVAKVNPQGKGLVYCGYIGGSSSDRGLDVAVDATGAAYVIGTTQSSEQTFPVAVGPDLTHNGSTDTFVAKVNPQGTGLVYCGYIGGIQADSGQAIAVDAAGAAYVAGTTPSTEQTFPVTVGPDLTHNGANDAFVAKVNAKGTGLLYCGYVGGSSNDNGSRIAVDAAGAAYVAGQTQSTEQTFPGTVGPDLTHNGGYDAFVAKVNPQGTGLVYAGYIGGASPDYGYGVAVDAAGSAYVTGQTQSTEQTFPVAVGPDLTYNGGTYDAFTAKVNPQGSGLVYAGYVGGSSTDSGRAVVVDAAGAAYVVGQTGSTEQTFPVTAGPDLTHNGGTDTFVVKIHPQGTGLVYAGYIGGVSADYGYGIAVDAARNAYVTGQTSSTEQTFPVTVGPDLTYNGGSYDAFVTKVSLTLLVASGSPRPGGQVGFSLTASDDVGLPYQMGSSLGTGPIPIDTRQLGLSPDALLLVSIGGALPQVFMSYAGTIGTNGQAQAQLDIPNVPALVGLRIHSAFITLSAAAPSGLKSISNTESFTIAK